jgi:predicted nucleotidyltransferase
MRRDEALSILRAQTARLRALGVASLELFGSVARDEAGPQSDVDLLVVFDHPVGLFELLDVQDELELLLGRKVDLVPRDALKPRIRDRVMAEAVRAA